MSTITRWVCQGCEREHLTDDPCEWCYQPTMKPVTYYRADETYVLADALVTDEFIRNAFFPLGPNVARGEALFEIARNNMQRAIDKLTPADPGKAAS